MKWRGGVAAAAVLLAALAPAAARPDPLLLTPAAPGINQTAPARFQVRLETTRGPIVLEVERDWSPHGVDRFYNLVRHGYYDDACFFRVVAGRWAQFGIAADPRVATAWRQATIPDDPRVLSNTRGTVAFAFAVPNGRTTQVFINLRDNASTHDPEGFVPFARVSAGMDVADALYSGYGEQSGSGIRAGHQDALFRGGSAWLRRNFPKLDYIKKAKIMPPAR